MDRNDITRPDADLTEAYQLFAEASDRSDSWPQLANRGIAALCGIGHVLIAIHRQLTVADDHAAELTAEVHAVADQLGDLALPADRLADAAEDLTSRRRWFRRGRSAQPARWAGERLPAPVADEAAELAVRARRWRFLLTAAANEAPLADSDVITALAGLWSAGAWQRLDIYRAPAGGIGGYCITADGTEVSTAEALADPAAYPPGITELAALFIASGWRRFEVLGRSPWSCPGGSCERADGSWVTVSDCLAVPPGGA